MAVVYYAIRAEAGLATAQIRSHEVTGLLVGSAAGADGGCRGGSSDGRGLIMVEDIPVSELCSEVVSERDWTEPNLLLRRTRCR